VRALLKIGTDPNQRITMSGFDWPPLALALAGHHYRIAEVLLQNKADVNLRWCTVSSVQNHRQVGIKLDAGCTDAAGRAGLMWSAEGGDVTAVRLLLDQGADTSLKDWAGRTAADLAKTVEIKALIESHR
jgi:ankyrin repeat protein